MKEDPRFIHITTEYGWIGNMCWINSSTMPTYDPAYCGLTVHWGGCSLSWPDLGISLRRVERGDSCKLLSLPCHD